MPRTNNPTVASGTDLRRAANEMREPSGHVDFQCIERLRQLAPLLDTLSAPSVREALRELAPSYADERSARSYGRTGEAIHRLVKVLSPFHPETHG